MRLRVLITPIGYILKDAPKFFSVPELADRLTPSPIYISYSRKNARDVMVAFNSMSPHERNGLASIELLACLWASSSNATNDRFAYVVLDLFKVDLISLI